MRPLCLALAVFATLPAPCRAQALLEALDGALALHSADAFWRADVSGLLDLETYVPETPALGLLNTDDEVFFNPRLTLFLDLQAGETLRAHAQMRVDRGFDPGFAPDGQTRLDEYFMEWRPLGDDTLAFRAGKSATVFGAWTRRHFSWDNPFVTAPAAYSDMLPVTDHRAAPRAALLGRRGERDNPLTWLPVVWGPSYATGLSVFGQVSDFDYALEIKNAALSSRPHTWDAAQNGWTSTTWTGRLGWKPAPEWAFGGSFSHGPYLLETAQRSLPRGRDFEDYAQTTFALDAAWAHGPWQVWGELMTSRFAIPNAGGVRVLTGFIEAKRKLGSGSWLAARWNQSWFGDVPGTSTAWDNDGWRADLALGHRLSRHLQAKLQYSLAGRSGPHDEGEHLLAAQITVRF